MQEYVKLIMRTTVFVQVDMKIMYYELIKMLIEYERNKQPEVKDKIRLKLDISKICDKKYQFHFEPINSLSQFSISRCGTQARVLARLKATRWEL